MTNVRYGVRVRVVLSNGALWLSDPASYGINTALWLNNSALASHLSCILLLMSLHSFPTPIMPYNILMLRFTKLPLEFTTLKYCLSFHRKASSSVLKRSAMTASGVLPLKLLSPTPSYCPTPRTI